jgi:hypothetical protein
MGVTCLVHTCAGSILCWSCVVMCMWCAWLVMCVFVYFEYHVTIFLVFVGALSFILCNLCFLVHYVFFAMYNKLIVLLSIKESINYKGVAFFRILYTDAQIK